MASRGPAGLSTALWKFTNLTRQNKINGTHSGSLWERICPGLHVLYLIPSSLKICQILSKHLKGQKTTKVSTKLYNQSLIYKTVFPNKNFRTPLHFLECLKSNISIGENLRAHQYKDTFYKNCFYVCTFLYWCGVNFHLY